MLKAEQQMRHSFRLEDFVFIVMMLVAVLIK